jgi:transposase
LRVADVTQDATGNRLCVEASAMPGALVPFYPAADDHVQPAPAAGAVACRCCPGVLSRSIRARRYPSDMTEAEWALCEPMLPSPAWLAGRGGRPASWCMRDIVDAIRYLTHNGPVWRALPADFPPAGTVYWRADKWQAGGSAERMRDDLRERVRVAAGRSPRPAAAIIGSRSVKGSEMIARTRRGYDAGKKINGTRRHIAVDVLGLLLTVLVTAASLQDRDAAKPLLWNPAASLPLHQAGLGRRRLRRQARHLGRGQAQAGTDPGDRQAPR